MKKRVVVVKRAKPAQPQAPAAAEPEVDLAAESNVRVESTKYVMPFNNKLRELSGAPGKQRNYILTEFERIVGETAPEDVPLVLLKKRVAYELLARPYTEAGLALPPRLLEQVEKSRKMSFSAWTRDEAFQMSLYVKALPLGDGTMATPKQQKEGGADKAQHLKRTGGKTGLTVTQWYADKMDKQHKAKLTDEELAAEYAAEFPETKPRKPDYFNHVRGVYNLGNIPCQAGKGPAVPVPQFVVEGKARLAVPFKGKGATERNAECEKAGVKFVKVAEPEKPAAKTEPAAKGKKAGKPAAPAKKKVVVKK